MTWQWGHIATCFCSWNPSPCFEIQIVASSLWQPGHFGRVPSGASSTFTFRPSSLIERSSRLRQGLLHGGDDRLGGRALRPFAAVEDIATVDLDPELSHPAGLPRH